MFRRSIYKIITLVMLFASLLGPRVASGEFQSPSQSAIAPAGQEQVLPVVTAAQDQIIMAVETAISCATNLQSSITTLLWQNCELAVMPAVTSEAVDVVVAPAAAQTNKLTVAAGPRYAPYSAVHGVPKESSPAVVTPLATVNKMEQRLPLVTKLIYTAHLQTLLIDIQIYNMIMRC